MDKTPAPNGKTEEAFVVELDDFSGPLDLLWHLIREDELDILDIPIARVADQFLRAINVLGLNQAADYLEMAARLLRIKAQMLLPRPLSDDDWEDPRYELVRRLLEYQQIREVADWLAHQASHHADRWPRGFVPAQPALPPPPLQVEISDLLGAVEDLLATIPDAVLHRVVPRPLNVEAAARRLDAFLERHDMFSWLELLGDRPSLVDVLSMLIALLEYARLRRVEVGQPEPFAPLMVKRGAPDQDH